MSVVVRKSPVVVVKPSEEPVMTRTGKIDLSPYDKCFVGMPATALLVFDHPIHEPAETIKRSLSQALIHYHPIAGRLDNDMIKCTGEGVPFVAASANCAIKDVVEFSQKRPPHVTTSPSLLDDLAIYYPAAMGSTDPLLMMQVTDFSCGGFVVGVTWNHAITDGVGMGQFLGAVGELARGRGLSLPSVVPVRSPDDSVMLIPPYIGAFMRNASSSFQPFDMALLDITVPSSVIDRIKLLGGTVFEAVTAVLWQCRTRATITDPEAPSVLFFTVDARKYVGTKDGYYGNCLTLQQVEAASGTVANAGVMDIVKMIQHAKHQIPNQFNKQLAVDKMPQQLQLGYNQLFIVTTWRNLGLDQADFGGGKPARVMTHTQHRMDVPCCTVCLPSQNHDGSNVASLCVKEDHAQAFLRELASFTTC